MVFWKHTYGKALQTVCIKYGIALKYHLYLSEVEKSFKDLHMFALMTGKKTAPAWVKNILRSKEESLGNSLESRIRLYKMDYVWE